MSQSARIIAILATLPSLILIIALVRGRFMRVKFALLWLPVTLAMLVFSLVPGLSDQLADVAGVAYPPTVLLVSAVGLLMFVAIHLSWELSRLDERVRILAEQVAIDGARRPSDEAVEPALGSPTARS